LQNEEENIDEDPGYFSDGRKKPVRKEVEELLEIKEFKIENTSGIIKDNRKIPLKFTTMKIKGLGIKP
jgi:DNA polymerase-1